MEPRPGWPRRRRQADAPKRGAALGLMGEAFDAGDQPHHAVGMTAECEAVGAKARGGQCIDEPDPGHGVPHRPSERQGCYSVTFVVVCIKQMPEGARRSTRFSAANHLGDGGWQFLRANERPTLFDHRLDQGEASA